MVVLIRDQRENMVAIQFTKKVYRKQVISML